MTGVYRLGIDLADLDREVGTKAASLGVLTAAGFDVPCGVVVVGPPDQAALRSFLQEHTDGRWAVRSSATGEDLPSTSAAGRYRTFLDVDTADVVDRIVDCRRHAATVDGCNGAPIPVIVQRMAQARRAGVAFTADPVTGDRETTVVSLTAGLAHALLSGEVGGEEWAVTGRRVTRRRAAGRRVGTRRVVARVAATARAVADRLGAPQDVEWVDDGARICIVQSRPITPLPPAARWQTPHRGVFHRGFRFGEWIGEPISPLSENWLLSRMEARLHQLHRAQLGQYAPRPHHIVVNGWYFYSLNFLPVPGGSARRSLPSMLRLLPRTPRRLAVMFPLTVLAGYGLYERDWREDLSPRYAAAVAEAAGAVDALAPQDLVDLLDDLCDLAGEYFASIAVVAGSGYKVETVLAQLWNRAVGPVTGTSHLELLAGLSSTAHASGPLLLSLDWAVDPLPGPPSASPAAPRADLAHRRAAAEAAARRVLASSPRRLRRFEGLLQHAQHLQPVREQQMAELATAWPVMRRAVDRLGAALTATGAIDTPDDVVLLTRPEIVEVLAEPRPLQDRVRRRREEMAAARRLVPPQTVGRMPLMTRVAFNRTNAAFGARRVTTALVSGVPTSPGVATGPVRIVRGPADFDAVRDGDVVVTPTTTPALTPLFARAAALVTDVGSGLAHGSIMAREFGIPAVVGCGDACARLEEARMVRVDGTTGAVTAA